MLNNTVAGVERLLASDGSEAVTLPAGNEVEASILRDVIRFVPELAPLAADAFDRGNSR
jgi:hypothetical protein